ncbi:ROK family transcriptional regulator [Rhodococcus sp. ZPP]|uniref:ROK family transcriptional regulator n=1 Tax=Rhodococcus sp. ZPP TaxID=2749906 RepID=UPI001AD860D9|nr:ROK family transcriptional regulator [Rhodococcus sp. ZPP]QTJ67195.1 ROK family transcriptional regulator [Rhodococcus sp. ZPP]
MVRTHSDARRGAGRSGASAGTVLRTILDHGPIARSTIARVTGLSPATVTTASAQLVERGLLRELPEISGPTGLGRPHVPVDLDTTRFVVYGIHLAMTHVTTALLDLRGQVLARSRDPHFGLGPAEILRNAVTTLEALAAGYGDVSVPIGVGFAAGGWIDSESGVVREHPIPGWNGYPVRTDLERRTGLDVRMDSHARALIDAEVLFGEPRSRDSVVQLFVGNVIDAAFATGGVIHHGPRAAAGAVAHVPLENSIEKCTCGRTGCVQATLSDRVLVRRAMQLGIIERPIFGELLDAGRRRQPAALALFEERAYGVGVVAARLLDLFNPEVLIVCDQGVSRIPGSLDTVRRAVGESSATCDDPSRSVLSTSFPGRALPVSAGSVILAELYRAPLTSFVRPLAGIS